jgi:hypothetical protein
MNSIFSPEDAERWTETLRRNGTMVSKILSNDTHGMQSRPI